MNLKEKTLFLGIGCCGGKQAKEFITTYGYKGYAINGSEQDLKALGNIPKYHLSGFDGFGGHRDKALDCLEQSEEFMNQMDNIKEEVIFILFGGGGSTGSGCGTILSEMLAQNPDKIVCPVISLPSSDEAIVKHSNAYQAVQELQDIEGLGATFFINNDVGKDYNHINSVFAKFLNTFLTNNSYGELNNFDESERLEMLKDGGAMVLSLCKVGIEPTFMLERLTKNGIFAPIESNQICEHIAIIHAGSNNKDLDVGMVIAETGKPRNVFEGYNGRNTMVAVSGLDYPVSHVSKLGELAKTAYEERMRDRKQIKKLADLSFMEQPEEKPEHSVKKKPSKFQLLRSRRNANM